VLGDHQGDAVEIDKGKWFNGLMALGCLLFLAAIFVPTVSTRHHGPSVERMVRSQMSQYVTALQMFRGEYGEFPDFMEGQSRIDLSDAKTCDQFIEAISGRKRDGAKSSAYGNRRGITFYSFSESEIPIDAATGYRCIQTADGNTNLMLFLDHDGDGILEVESEGKTQTIRRRVTMATVATDECDAVTLWE
jgi:hypothetical protein